MLVLESYKPMIELDLQEIAMTRANVEFDRAGAAAEREELWREPCTTRRAPGDELMYAWSMKVSEQAAEETVPAEPHLEMCPPEVYIG